MKTQRPIREEQRPADVHETTFDYARQTKNGRLCFRKRRIWSIFPISFRNGKNEVAHDLRGNMTLVSADFREDAIETVEV